MKPQNKTQKYIIALSQALPSMTQKIEPWAIETCLHHIGYRNKTKTSCLMCGHDYKGSRTAKKENCPSCGRKLTIEQTQNRNLTQRRWYCVLDVVEGYQVARYFEIHTTHKTGIAPKIWSWEIVQHWIMPEERTQIIARMRNTFFGSTNFTGDLDLRNPGGIENTYNVYPDHLYPEMKVLPIYQRNGFKNNLHGCSPHSLFTSLLHNSVTETLLKTKHGALLDAYLYSYDAERQINRHWGSVKIAIRNKYVISDVKMWLDYLDMLQFFSKDLRNAMYVCPKNIKKAHDEYVAKKRAHDARIRAERAKMDAEAKKREQERVELMKATYEQRLARFFGIELSTKELKLVVLKSVAEIEQEGTVLNHCVFTNAYYAKEDSLLLSVRKGDQPIETVEISLKQAKVLQARGWDNKDTAYHNKVLRLVNRAMPTIIKTYKQSA